MGHKPHGKLSYLFICSLSEASARSGMYCAWRILSDFTVFTISRSVELQITKSLSFTILI